MSAPRRCIVLVGGYGSRMRPLTDTRPKHLLPVAGVPLLDLVVGRLVEHGVREIALAVAVHAELIAGHVARRPGQLARDGVRTVLSTETRPLGTGGAIVTAAHLLEPAPEEAILVVNGDLLTAHDVEAQAALLDHGADVALHVRPVDDPRPFGTVRCDDEGVVLGFEEKVPGPSGTLVNAGTYALRAGLLLDQAPGRPSSWEHDLLPRLIDRGLPVRAHRESAWFADVGTPASLVAASRAVVLGHARGAVPRSLAGSPAVSQEALVSPSAVVTDGSSLGRAGAVAARAQVRGSVLLDHVVVEEGAQVSRSVVGEGAVIGAGAVLEGCVVADEAVVPAGARLPSGSVVEVAA